MHHSQFPQTLKNLRREKNITQEELARFLHVTRPTIAGYEARNKQPDYDKLIQLAEYFDVTIDYLITGQNPSSSKLYETAERMTNKQLDIAVLQTFRRLSYSSKQKVIEYSHLLQLYENTENVAQKKPDNTK